MLRGAAYTLRFAYFVRNADQDVGTRRSGTDERGLLPRACRHRLVASCQARWLLAVWRLRCAYEPPPWRRNNPHTSDGAQGPGLPALPPLLHVPQFPSPLAQAPRRPALEA